MRPPRRGSSVHLPVLRREVLEFLDLSPGMTVVDATVGGGSHSAEILEQIHPGGVLVGIDRDQMMLALAETRLQSSPAIHSQTCLLRQGSYVELPEILAAEQIGRVDRVLADLGLSSDQLADEQRGFSFESRGPLDLRFDTSSGEPAWKLLQTRTHKELSEILERFGEEPQAEAIARKLVAKGKQRAPATSESVAAAVASVVKRGGRGQIHPATRVFQALRIAVNRELEHVEALARDVLPAVVASGGRAAVISFHSLEDRIIKNAFRHRELWEPLTRKPIEATAAEKRHNPRARSAKLRVAVRK